MNRLDEIRARLDAATPGPWEHKFPPQDGTLHRVVCDRPSVDDGRTWKVGICQLEDTGYSAASSWAQRSNDAALIAHAPTDLRDLLAVAEAAEAVDREWRERGDGGCTTDVRLSLSAALARLHTAEVSA